MHRMHRLTAGVVPSDYAEECEVPGDDDDDDDDDLFSVTGAEFVAGFVGIVIFALTLIIAMAIWFVSWLPLCKRARHLLACCARCGDD